MISWGNRTSFEHYAFFRILKNIKNSTFPRLHFKNLAYIESSHWHKWCSSRKNVESLAGTLRLAFPPVCNLSGLFYLLLFCCCCCCCCYLVDWFKIPGTSNFLGIFTSNFLGIFTKESGQKLSFKPKLESHFEWWTSLDAKASTTAKATPGHEPCGKLYVWLCVCVVGYRTQASHIGGKHCATDISSAKSSSTFHFLNKTPVNC